MYLLCKPGVVLCLLLVESYVFKHQDLQSRAHETFLRLSLCFLQSASAGRLCYLAILQLLCLLLDLVANAVIGFEDLRHSRRHVDATTQIHWIRPTYRKPHLCAEQLRKTGYNWGQTELVLRTVFGATLHSNDSKNVLDVISRATVSMGIAVPSERLARPLRRSLSSI